MLTTGLHTAQSLSRDFHLAYCDIHDHVLTRSSVGKLAWLVLSQSRVRDAEAPEARIHFSMTHQARAPRIGASRESRETVTRLLSDLRRKQLIRRDGPTMIIHHRYPEDGFFVTVILRIVPSSASPLGRRSLMYTATLITDLWATGGRSRASLQTGALPRCEYPPGWRVRVFGREENATTRIVPAAAWSARD